MKQLYRKSAQVLTIVCLILGLISLASAKKPGLPPNSGNNGGSEDNPVKLPAPATIDQVTHDLGNLATTVDNWGYIGGYQSLGRPSGEWPSNSNRNYLAEIRYWMGTITSAGDTLVANTYDDFQSIPSLVNAVSKNKILLSTDTTRYYYYDPLDTVGGGLGSAANGWKIWDNQLSAWVYTKNYNPLDSTFYNGGPISLQESHYRFADDALGSSLLGLEMTHTVMQWNFCYNEDFIFVVLNIKNNSTTDYNNFAFGLYVDLDVGGPDGTGENGRLRDMVGSDTTENLAWTYDVDGYDPGWQHKTGVMGTKYLETPGGVGMTAFRTGDWSALPSLDEGRFALINSNQVDVSLPPTDQYYIQCTRGINLTAGSSVRVVYALIAGGDVTEFRENAALAQNLYDNNFIGPEPPVAPTLTAAASDEKIYLYWNDASQKSIDPLSGENDFAGYKIYRSDNRGKTWGDTSYAPANNCQSIEYDTLIQYKVNNPSDPIPQSYIDTAGLINGVEYWYCIVAYDTGASATGVDILQNGFGSPKSASNIISVRPVKDPIGFYDAAGTVNHKYNGTNQASVGSVTPIVFDPNLLQGSNYSVTFEDSAKETYWHLVNLTTGDTVLAYQTRDKGVAGLYNVTEGIRVVVRNPDRVPRFMGQTTIGGVDSTLSIASFFGPVYAYLIGDPTRVYGDQHYRSSYEIRFTGDSTLATSVYAAWYPSDPQVWLPFEVWNTSTNQRVSLGILEFLSSFDGIWQTDEPIAIINYPYNPATDLVANAFPEYYSWMWAWDDAKYNPSTGDVFTIDGPLLNSPEDQFLFAANGVNSAAATSQLSSIKVVPNPYYAHSTMWEVAPEETAVQFQNLPDACTIRIYSLSGDLLKTIKHDDGTGAEFWNLHTEGHRLVSSGMYIFHVESEYGERLGRFAIIK